MTDREIMQQALDALETADEAGFWELQKTVVSALRERLAQPEQEPRNIRERWNIELDGDDLLVCFNDHEKGQHCIYERYVSPQRKPLTDEEVVEVLGNLRESITGNVFLAFARAIEAAHDIKEGS